ncbi:hypothetical protein GUITHDRAFT_156886 [Guillardia theta CCMP2712]|uniref:Short/branched chain specific acyl-CoA dehydrogenase, mitochondrial n=1 Tax=Guillardia theta (strain CCMP2712) TaxID=905079 RepID=L1K2D9_GUITC|nr:hypothetical protein GUITHDRAFT_156886 [Guillardia theta CCMP2712]EKX54620.1 hypothetical protein GUITHDRAFT_156886 [Guillardia theta CCMP2712]|eukprot:XP_005841600.1 hypothetical protein GUITHDRAFT_156886 [Guillardia theta CCMP2712]
MDKCPSDQQQTDTNRSIVAHPWRHDPEPTSRPAVTALSEEELALKEHVSAFAKEVIGPKVREMDDKGVMDPEIIAACFEMGIMGIEAPVEYGGVGLGFTAACVVIEEIAKVDPAVAVMVDIHNTLNITAFNRYATTEQKEKYFPRLCKSALSSFCLSESGSGSDAFALKTKAEWDEASQEWVLNGTKSWISNSKEAEIFIIFANTDFSEAHKGITAFIVDKSNPGIAVGAKEDKLGIRASSTCEVTLENCRVSKDAMLGKRGQGYKMAIELLNEGRIGIGAQMVGLALGAFENTLPYLHERKQFGRSVADFQGMQFQYARALMEIEAAKVLVYNAARLKEAKAPFVMEAAMAKLKATEVAQSTASQCIDWLGGIGFTKGMPAEKYYRDSKIGTIYEGTSNIQLVTIAKQIQAGYRV